MEQITNVCKSAGEPVLRPERNGDASMTTRAEMLNLRQRRFVQEYLRCANGKEAAIRAGYSRRSAAEIAVHLKHKPKVARAIRLARSAEGRRAQIDADRVLAELARIAFSDLRRMADWGPGGLVLNPAAATAEEDRAAIAEIVTLKTRRRQTARIRLHNKLHALKALARHVGLYDRVIPNHDSQDAFRERKRLADSACAQLTAGIDANPLTLPSPPSGGEGK
jgi:phage terminase small subunit